MPRQPWFSPRGSGWRWRRNQSRARRATCSSVPGSSNRCVAPGMISSRVSPPIFCAALRLRSMTTGVAFSDDQQGGLPHLGQVCVGEVGSSAAGDDGLHGVRPVRGGDERGRGAGAGPEQADAEAGGGFAVRRPVGQRRDPAGEQVDVEPQRGGPQVDLLLLPGEQVGQHRGQAGAVELVGDVAIPWAVPATAAAVGEQHRSAPGSRGTPRSASSTTPAAGICRL